VAADRADATLVWEPGLATGLQKIEGSRVLITIDEYLKKHVGREGPYFALSIQNEALKRDPSVARRLEDVYHELFAYVDKHPDEFAEMGKVQDLDPAIMKLALTSGRLKLALRPVREAKHKADMQFFADLLSEAGGLPGKLDGNFYIG
jgi:ABC-type nitrate/sulfonate/bicarbonate transport system substrate-binding protein